jgi:hypothetical protein
MVSINLQPGNKLTGISAAGKVRAYGVKPEQSIVLAERCINNGQRTSSAAISSRFSPF